MLLFGKRKKEKEPELSILPRHVGIIMDGNGRWAKKRGLPRSAGHSAGAETLKKIVKEANLIGIEYLTVYAFSTENWKRPESEVKYLMSLLLDYLKNAEKTLAGDDTVIKIIGSRNELSAEIQEQIIKTEKLTENNSGTVLNIALNYGGREELTSAVRQIAKSVQQGDLKPADITEDNIEHNLYTASQPDVDLLIRTSGEQRLSNFMLWQVSYAEMWFTDRLWPDFKPEHFRAALSAFGERGRRFGGV